MPSFKKLRRPSFSLLEKPRALIQKASEMVRKNRHSISEQINPNTIQGRRRFLIGMLGLYLFPLNQCAHVKDYNSEKESDDLIREGDFFTIERGSRQPLETKEIPNNLYGVVIFVMHNGERKKIELSTEELHQNPIITIKGYVVSIMSMGSQPLKHLKFSTHTANPMVYKKDGEEIQVEGGDIQGEYKLHFNQLFDDKTKAEKIRKKGVEQAKKADNGEVPGFYNINHTQYNLGAPLYSKSSNKLRFETEAGDLYWIKINQSETRECMLTACIEIDGFKFFIEGYQQKRFEKITDLKRKLQAIAYTIQLMNIKFGLNVNKVYLRDNNQDNATVVSIQEKINIFYGALKSDSLDAIRTTTEHEMLHIIAEKNGLNGSAKIRERFCKLKDYTGDKKVSVMKNGKPPKKDGNNSGNKAFFDFITENHYVPKSDSDSGHPYDNVQEFNTSFLHAVMHIKHLENNLKKELTFQDWKTVKSFKDGRIHITATKFDKKRKPKPSDKMMLLKHFVETIDLLIEEIESQPDVIMDEELLGYLHHKRIIAKNLQSKIKTEIRKRSRRFK